MLVQVVEVQKQWIIVEYTDNYNFVQRKYIPKSLMDVSIKGSYNVSDRLLNYGVEYSDVDLVKNIGKEYNNIDVEKLQDSFRRRGFWKKEDYVLYSTKINGILYSYSGVMKLNTLFNASQA